MRGNDNSGGIGSREQADMRLGPGLSFSWRRALVGFAAALVATCASLAISAGYMFLHPHLSRGAGFLFGDEASNLFTADAMHRGQQLFVDAAFPYGPVSITLFAAIAKVAGNTPVAYLGALAILAAVSAGLAAHLISRFVTTWLALGIAVAGLLPSMPLPGAPIGGYTSSLYYPVERIALLVALLLWKAPAERSGWRSIAIGGVLGFSQGVRFGTGVVMLAAVLAGDALMSRSEWRRDGLRAAALLLSGFAAAECGWIAWAALTLPKNVAIEVLWPLQMWETHQASGAARWPVWAGWRMGVTQGVMPAIAIALGVAGVIRGTRHGTVNAAHVALLFYVLGAVLFFRNEYHLRQFAWVLVIGAAPVFARLPTVVSALLLVMWLPALWPIASALAHRPPADVVTVHVPRGYELYVPRTVADRLRALERYKHAGAVLFVPNGAGWLYGYDVAHVTRHTWFYSAAVVRPFEESEFERGAPRASAMIRCDGENPTKAFSSSIASFLEQNFHRVETSDGCAIWKPLTLE